MASKYGGGKLLAAGLLLMMMLPVLAAGSAWAYSMSDGDSRDRYESDWEAMDKLKDELDSPSKGEEPELQVEATKNSWIAELTEKADGADGSADLIEEIRARTSSSGLRSLRAACKAMCPKCICGVILLPGLPPLAKAKHKEPKKPTTKKPKKTTTKKTMTKKTTPKPSAAVTKKPEPPKVTPKPPIGKAKMPPPPAHAKEAVKKAKKWLSEFENLESQLPDFLLDEGSTENAYKKEVDDHDPLSQSGESMSEFGIE